MGFFFFVTNFHIRLYIHLSVKVIELYLSFLYIVLNRLSSFSHNSIQENTVLQLSGSFEVAYHLPT